MKTLIPILTLTLAIFAAAPLRAQAQSSLENDPAYLAIDKAIDLNSVRPEVNINLPRFLLRDAISGLTGGTNDPFASAGVDLPDLIKDIKLIRLVVIESNATNRAELTRGMAKLRSVLETKWTPIVVVPEDNVGIYAIGDSSDETMAGLAMLVHDDGDAVVANVVGRVSIGKIVKLASHFDKFPKDILKKLSESGAASGEKAETKSTKKAN